MLMLNKAAQRPVTSLLIGLIDERIPMDPNDAKHLGNVDGSASSNWTHGSSKNNMRSYTPACLNRRMQNLV